MTLPVFEPASLVDISLSVEAVIRIFSGKLEKLSLVYPDISLNITIFPLTFKPLSLRENCRFNCLLTTKKPKITKFYGYKNNIILKKHDGSKYYRTFLAPNSTLAISTSILA